HAVAAKNPGESRRRRALIDPHSRARTLPARPHGCVQCRSGELSMSPKHLPWASSIVAISAFCSLAASAEPALPERLRPITEDVALRPSPNDWVMWRRTYDSWGYSPLDQINKRNIANLQLAWAWTQELGNQEAAPLVRDGIMYLAQSNNVVHALDAMTGNLIWEYRP